MKQNQQDCGDDVLGCNLSALIQEDSLPPSPTQEQRESMLKRLLQRQSELVESRRQAKTGSFETCPDSEASMETIVLELRRLAASKIAMERPGYTLCPTELVNEAFLRLKGFDQAFENRRYFFGTASEAMRRILVERARRRKALKRGSDAPMVPLEDCEVAYEAPLEDEKLLLVHQALDVLEELDERQAEIVRLLVFVGLKQKEVAQLLELSPRKVRREWRDAKVWLYQHLTRG